MHRLGARKDMSTCTSSVPETPAVPEEIKVIDPQFWTNWLADYIASAVERREAAASRLITALSWFWTVYTVSALVGTALYSANLDAWAVPLVLSPIATLSAAYLCALWALNPIVGSIRQTESDAQALWSRLLDQKLRRLRLASALLVLSVVLILASGIVVATSPA
jgi:hypothetical protein